ncbi:hypothetical protein BY996DRAFT_6452958 [Phakopsora pachyrhizi]|nr:hypothetical protein BY996DRAFT_6452958 [Phakopsora pachyrhizi]
MAPPKGKWGELGMARGRLGAGRQAGAGLAGWSGWLAGWLVQQGKLMMEGVVGVNDTDMAGFAILDLGSSHDIDF